MTDTSAAYRVLNALRDEIGAGQWPTGSRLPSERALTERFETSRVVVREALAALRSLGMVAPRKGSGVYVTAHEPRSEGLVLAPRTRAEILDTLELRRAIEVEAAGLAASRAGPAQFQRIGDALEAMRRAVEAGQGAAAHDWAFHVAIAEATNNACFPRTMTAFGADAIPRLRRAAKALDDPERERRLLDEHESIFVALAAQDAEASRQAMHTHLSGALARYRSSAVA